MAKLIYINAQGIQQCEEVGPGGGCNDKSKEIWNENTDGPIDPELLLHVGSLKRDGKEIKVDDAEGKKNAEAKLKYQAESEKSEKEKSVRKEIFKSINKAATVEEVRAVLKALLEELGL